MEKGFFSPTQMTYVSQVTENEISIGEEEYSETSEVQRSSR